MSKSLLAGVGIGVAIIVLVLILASKNGKPVGISLNEPSFGASNVSYASVACGSNGGSGTGTVLIATSTGRMSLSALNTGAIAVYLCRTGDTCRTTSSTAVISTTSTLVSNIYNQPDAYIGPYTCVSNGATTTITVSQAQ